MGGGLLPWVCEIEKDLVILRVRVVEAGPSQVSATGSDGTTVSKFKLKKPKDEERELSSLKEGHWP